MQSKLASHLAPGLVELLGFLLSHILIMIESVHLGSYSLLHHLPALVVQHPLVTCLLKPCA